MKAFPKPAFITSGPHLSGFRVCLGYNTLAEAQAAHEALAAQPSAGAQGEVVAWGVQRTDGTWEASTDRERAGRWAMHGHYVHALVSRDATPAQPDTGDVAALRSGGYSLKGEALEMITALEAEALRLGKGRPTDVPGIHKTLWSAAQRIRLADEAEWWSTIGKAQLAALSKPNAPGAA